MKSNLLKAREIFNTGKYTYVLCKDDDIRTGAERGVRPLIDLLESNDNFAGYSACDKVVGKAAALLYVLLGVSEVYAPVMSEAAVRVFEKNNIKYDCGIQTAVIRNRSNTGNCPMEQTVADVENPDEAFKAIKLKLSQISS